MGRVNWRRGGSYSPAPAARATACTAKAGMGRLRESLLEPNARVDTDFRAVTVATADGHEIRGVAKSYTNYSVGILDARGELHMLSTRDLKRIELIDKSLMPDNYAQRLTPQEIENVLAFLSRQTIQ